MKINAIFYDCVGPLLIKDESVVLDSITSEIDKMCGGAVNNEEFWREVSNKFNLTKFQKEDIIRKIVGSYIKNQPMWNFHEKIREKYKTAIINNGTYTIFEQWKNKFEMENKFDALFNSSLLGVKKPDRKIFEIAATKLNSNLLECLLIDDSKYNVEGAINIGMAGITYNPNDHQSFLSEIGRVL